jgi:cytochrome P450
MLRMEPTNPIDAVAHRDPYPYYGRLLAGPPLYFDEELRLWVAARAGVVSEAFANPSLRVRPLAEPVPKALEGLPAGKIFARLVRMNDGSGHDAPKLALQRALASIPLSELNAKNRLATTRRLISATNPAALTNWAFEAPTAVVAELLGFPHDESVELVKLTREFVACLSPLSTPEQLSQANAAASRMEFLLDSIERAPDSLVSRVRSEAGNVDWIDHASIVANLIGLLSQTHEATAGLIGNSIVALANQPALLGEVRALADGWHELVHEASRYDSPVQNTRRFVVEPATIGGMYLPSGAVVLLVLAAANRDPNANPEPHLFRLERSERCVFSFGRGSHACPGETLARCIAATALSVLFDTMPIEALASLAWSWKPSTNGRLPLFHAANA